VGRAEAGETTTPFGDGNLEKWREVAVRRCPIRTILLAPNLETGESGFFVLWTFLKNREMNSAETYFYVLALLSRASLVGATHEVVTSCALVRLMGPACAHRATLVSVVPCRSSHAMSVGATPS
jgi:hypothetical protein